MKAVLKSFHLAVLGCLFVVTQCKPGEVLPPRNVTALWYNDFNPALSWDPPQHSVTNCSYDVSVQANSYPTRSTPRSENTTQKTSPEGFFIVMEGGSINWRISTVCEGSKSKPVLVNISYPELVKKLDCFLKSPNKAECEWSLGTHSPNFRFFYGLVNECTDKVDPFHLQECPSYVWTNGVRSGCRMDATRCHALYALFNATLNDKPVRNTFKRMLMKHVRPKNLTWAVQRNGNKFNISWEVPEIKVAEDWTIEINYTECGPKDILERKDQLFEVLELNPLCRKAITARATSSVGQTPWGEWKHYEGDKDPRVLLLVVVLLIVVLVVLIGACFQKNKEKLWPAIPKPKDYLSEFSNATNNKTFSHILYSPVKEENGCNVLLVVDLQHIKENC